MTGHEHAIVISAGGITAVKCECHWWWEADDVSIEQLALAHQMHQSVEALIGVRHVG